MAKSRIVLPHSRAYNQTTDSMKRGKTTELEERIRRQESIDEDEDRTDGNDFIKDYPEKRQSAEDREREAKEAVEKNMEAARTEQQLIYAASYVKGFLKYAEALNLKPEQKDRIKRVCDALSEEVMAGVQEGGPNKGRIKVVLKDKHGKVQRNPDGSAIFQYEGLPVDELLELMKNITGNVADVSQRQQNKIKELEEKYFFESEREQKANYYNQLERAKKDFRAWEQLMDENYYQTERISKLVDILEGKSQSHFQVQFGHEAPLSPDELMTHAKRVEHEALLIAGDDRVSKDVKNAEKKNLTTAEEALKKRREIVLDGESDVSGNPKPGSPEAVAASLEEQMKRLNKVSVVDASEQARFMARLRADERLNERMNAGLRGDRLREFLKDLSHFKWNGQAIKDFAKSISIKRLALRTWTVAAEEGYRQKYIQEELARIQGIGEDGKRDENLFGDETKKHEHRAEMSALAHRFQENLFALDEKKGDTLTGTEENKHINSLVKEYAETSMTDDEFEAKKDEIIKTIRDKYPGPLGKEALLTADNILETAKEFRKIYEHSERMARLDVNLQIDLGKAKRSIKTKANEKGFDKVVGVLQRHKLGRLVAPTTLGFMASLATYVAKKPFVAFAGLMAGSLIFGAARKHMQMNKDLAMHRAERAVGVKMDEYRDTHKRRAELEQFVVEMRSAGEIQALLNDLENRLKTADGSEKEALIQQALEIVGDADARMHLSEEYNVDFIGYEGETQIERSRIALLRNLAMAKVVLKESLGNDEYEKRMVDIVQAREDALEEDLRGKNKKFASLRSKRMVGAMVYGSLVGSGVGAIMQEGIHALEASIPDNSLQGTFLEGTLVEKMASKTGETIRSRETAIEKLAHIFGGYKGTAQERAFDADIFTQGRGSIRIPEGTKMVPDGNNVFTLVDEETGRVLINNLKINPDNGHVMVEGAVDGIEVRPAATVIASGQKNILDSGTNTNIFERMDEVHRTGWLRQNTEVSDYGELKFYFDGEGGTGYDANGNIDLDISKLRTGDSWEGSLRPDLTQLAQEGKLKVIFTPDTEHQHSGIVLDMDSDGHVRIDAKQDAWVHDFFGKDKNGRLTHSGYLEIAIDEGGNNYRIVSTIVGTEDFEPPKIEAEHTIHEVHYTENINKPYAEIRLPVFFRRPPGVRLRDGKTIEDARPNNKDEKSRPKTSVAATPVPPAPELNPAAAAAAEATLKEKGVRVVTRGQKLGSDAKDYGLDYPYTYNIKNSQELAQAILDNDALTDEDRAEVAGIDDADGRVTYIENKIVEKRQQYETPENKAKMGAMVEEVRKAVEKLMGDVSPESKNLLPKTDTLHLVGLYEFLAQKKNLTTEDQGYCHIESGNVFINMAALEQFGETEFTAKFKRILAEQLLRAAGANNYWREVLENGDVKVLSRRSGVVSEKEETDLSDSKVKVIKQRGLALNNAIAAELSDEVADDMGVLMDSEAAYKDERRKVLRLLESEFVIDESVFRKAFLDREAFPELIAALNGRTVKDRQVEFSRPDFASLFMVIMDFEALKGDGLYDKTRDLIKGQTIYFNEREMEKIAHMAPNKLIEKDPTDGKFKFKKEIRDRYKIGRAVVT